MKQAVVVALASAFFGPVAGLESRSSSTFARVWLASHAAPQSDELAELKDANPDAYAIVKALLTKRSLGLLDPKHPSASFSAPPPSADAPRGAAAYADLITPEELASHGHGAAAAVAPASEVPYADAPAPTVHHDWMNWKPSDSAASDDQMVQNVLGAVAELKGAKHAAPVASSQLDADAASLGLNSAPVASMPPSTAPAQGNSYLRGLNLEPEAPAVVATTTAAVAQPNYLASFSWGDDTKPGPQQQKRAVSAERKPKVSALSSWLGAGERSDVSAQQDTVAKKPAVVETNPYLAALQ